MSILANSAVRTGLQVVLAVVILVLGYFLYRTIQEPAAAYAREQALTEATRTRMDYIRDAMIAYERRYDRYPSTLDSLAQAIRTDSFFVARRDSIFDLDEGQVLPLDSLIYSPRTGQPFELTVARDDSTGTTVYLLEDPASNDYIGTDNPARSTGLLNAASWE